MFCTFFFFKSYLLLCCCFRLKITEELHGLTYLMEVLDNILRNTIEDASKNNQSSLQVCHSLYNLYNLTYYYSVYNVYRKKMCYLVVRY